MLCLVLLEYFRPGVLRSPALISRFVWLLLSSFSDSFTVFKQRRHSFSATLFQFYVFISASFCSSLSLFPAVMSGRFKRNFKHKKFRHIRRDRSKSRSRRTFYQETMMLANYCYFKTDCLVLGTKCVFTKAVPRNFAYALCNTMSGL